MFLCPFDGDFFVSCLYYRCSVDMFKGRKVANPVVQGAGGGAYPKDTGLYAGVFYFTILKGYTIKDFTAIYNCKL